MCQFLVYSKVIIYICSFPGSFSLQIITRGIEYSFLCCAVVSCCLSILYILEIPFSAHILSGFVTSSKLQFGRLSGCLRHQGISRWLQGRVSFLKTLKQARNSQSPSLQRDGPARLKTPHSAAYPASALSGIAPSSLHAGPPQLTALSAVLIGTPSPHPCVSAHLQMTRGLIRRKCFTLSSPRKSFMNQNYKPLREIPFLQEPLFSVFSASLLVFPPLNSTQH